MVNSEKNVCELCGGTSRIVVEGFQGYKEDLFYSICECDHCKTSYCSPLKVDHKIYDVIYHHGKEVPGYARYWEFFENIKNQEDPLKYLTEKEHVFWAVNQLVSDLGLSKGKRILELGCGLGYLTYALRKKGYDATGLDISAKAISKAIDAFGEYYLCEDLFVYANSTSDKYDLIIMTELVEHLEQPIEFISAAKSLLNEGGKLAVTTPNKSFFPEDLVWETDSPPVHLWWFSEKSMEFMARKLNLSVAFVSFNDYYLNKPQAYKIQQPKNNLSRKPIVSKDGELILRNENLKGQPKGVIQQLLSKFPLLQRIVRNFLISMDSDQIKLGEKTTALCAVFQFDKAR